ncbi:hypothetical protein ['Paenibacillus yunnanensis' Narsing Rao et al. 2020]|uniref:hypothetical protein n=1 Tax=Paenibacillus tengchongensis TaxID=2608684 RepID=UPI001652ABA0|nr:hypothetical protein [Paenibacillus tengchongensis]
MLLVLAGCSREDAGSGDKAAAHSAGGPAISVVVGDRDLSGNAARQLSEAYQDGNSLQELFINSGVVTSYSGIEGIAAVNGVMLGADLRWELQVNGKVVTDWTVQAKREDNIVYTAQPGPGEEMPQFVILTVNGGTEQPELSLSLVLPYTEDMTVRNLLKNSDIVELAEDNKTVVKAQGYAPLSNEEWKLQVNNKGLRDSGIDMMLKPQDELEIMLTLQ